MSEMESKSPDKNKNYAFLVGIDVYKNLSHLPACVADVEQMRALLMATGKFQAIEVVKGEQTADQVKDKIRAFFGMIRASKVGEVFFYFSGHGTFDKDDVLLCCSDFNEKTPITSSLTNSEVDDLIRSISPALAVKVLDACNSGVPYVKDIAESFQKSLNGAKGQIGNFYCMASSQLDQSSYAQPESSDFTKSFIEGAIRRDSGSVLYRDINAFIADSFAGNSLQTPFFVYQGSGTEEFAQINHQMIALRTESKEKGDTQGLAIGLSQLDSEILTRDSLYVSDEAVQSALRQCLDSLGRAPIQDPVVSKYYSQELVWEGRVENLEDVSSLAIWAAKEGLDKKYLIDISFENYSESVPIPTIGSIFSSGSSFMADQPMRKITRRRASGLVTRHALPFEAVEIDFRSIKHPSLRTFRLRLALLHSRTEILVLSSMGLMKEIGWNKEQLDVSGLKWGTEHLLWRDVVSDVNRIWQSSFEKAVLSLRGYLDSIAPKEKDSLLISHTDNGKSAD